MLNHHVFLYIIRLPLTLLFDLSIDQLYTSPSINTCTDPVLTVFSCVMVNLGLILIEDQCVMM